MRKITDIINDLDAGKVISNYEVRGLITYIRRLERSNLALSDTVKDLSEQLEEIDCAYGDDLSVSD